MAQEHHLVYVPGITDDLHQLQSLAVKSWRLFGIKGHCHPMPWAGTEDYASKAERLKADVEKYISQDHKVSLMGSSAGASAALNLYVQRPDVIAGVVLICPKINNPESVNPKVYQENPAFRTSLQLLQANLIELSVAAKGRVVTYYSPKDGLIAYEDSRIPGVHEEKLPGLRHPYAIAYALSLGAPRLLKRLKLLAAN